MVLTCCNCSSKSLFFVFNSFPNKFQYRTYEIAAPDAVNKAGWTLSLFNKFFQKELLFSLDIGIRDKLRK
jgi:hypothetical protein